MNENLIPNSDRTPKEREELARKAGIASGEARREKKRLKELVELALEKKVNLNGEEFTIHELMALRVTQAAAKGDWKAWELTRDITGQKPADKVIIAEVSIDTINEIEEFLNND